VIGPVAFTGVEVVFPSVGVAAALTGPLPAAWLGAVAVVAATEVGSDVTPLPGDAGAVEVTEPDELAVELVAAGAPGASGYPGKPRLSLRGPIVSCDGDTLLPQPAKATTATNAPTESQRLCA
jgi:hypothetical protein